MKHRRSDESGKPVRHIAWTVDVETDWGGRCAPEGNGIRGIVEGLPRILECFSRYDITATFFVSGSFASRIAASLHDIESAGHEIACHGFHHRRLDILNNDELDNELRSGKQAVEAACSGPIRGFRAPQFVMPPGLFNALPRHGFTYDSSVVRTRFPGRYGRRKPELPPELREFALDPLPILNLPPGLLWVDKCGPGIYRSLVPHMNAAPWIVYLHPFDMLSPARSLRYGIGPALWYGYKRHNPSKLLDTIAGIHKDAGFTATTLGALAGSNGESSGRISPVLRKAR